MWEYYNPNPISVRVGDCAVRALCKVLGRPWESVYAELMLLGFQMCDMPSSNNVWGAMLRKCGFYRTMPDVDNPETYTAADFMKDHPSGTYVLVFYEHAAAVVDGVLYDTWDSSGEIPLFYWYRKDE